MKRYLIALVFLAIISGCSATSEKSKEANALPEQKILTSYYWQLQDAKDAQQVPLSALFVQKEKPVQIEFDNDHFYVSNTCNNMRGAYSINQNQLTLDSVLATKKMCDDQLSRLDDEIGKRFYEQVSYRISSEEKQPALTITTKNGDILTFIGKPTPETRFNSKGEIIFLEIAPQKTPCSKTSPEKQCMQVRQIDYDHNAVKSKTLGAWQDFDQNIEGYEFQTGVRNIIRVKKYSKNGQAKTPDQAVYILDMIIETENVKLKR